MTIAIVLLLLFKSRQGDIDMVAVIMIIHMVYRRSAVCNHFLVRGCGQREDEGRGGGCGCGGIGGGDSGQARLCRGCE